MEEVGQCENVKIKIREYHLKYQMFSIEMGCCDVVIGAEWLHTLGTITMDFNNLYMSLTKGRNTPFTG
jgi:hypothetical protein